MKKLIPADTVDVNGTVWSTIGENIRYGAKELPDDSAKEIVNILFPVGSVYCGENAFVLSVGKWNLLNDGLGHFVQLGGKLLSGSTYSAPAYVEKEGSTNSYVVIRMWKRVS